MKPQEPRPPHPQGTVVYLSDSDDPSDFDDIDVLINKLPVPSADVERIKAATASPLQRYRNIEEQLEALSKALWEVGREIMESMERDGATEWVDGPFTAKVKYSTTYSQDRLRATIPELVPQDALVKAKAYIPQHQETVLGRYDLTKLKPFGKQGAAIRKAIEDAKDQGPPRLTVTKEEEK